MHSRRMGSRSAGALAGDGRNFAQAGFNLNMGVFKSAVQGIHERPHRIIVLPEYRNRRQISGEAFDFLGPLGDPRLGSIPPSTSKHIEQRSTLYDRSWGLGKCISALLEGSALARRIFTIGD